MWPFCIILFLGEKFMGLLIYLWDKWDEWGGVELDEKA